MRRVAVFALLLLAASPLAAFDPTPARDGLRVVIVRTDAGDDLETMRVASMMRGYLARELRELGFDAVQSRDTLDDIGRGQAQNADVLIEFVRGDADDDGYGGIGVAGRHGGVEMGVVVSHVAAAIRVYDGSTLDLIDEFDVEARDSAVAPTAIGIGGRHVGVWVGVPMFRVFRQRAAAREAAEDAAETIAEILGSDR